MNKEKVILEGIHYKTGRVIRLGIFNGLIFSITDINSLYRAAGSKRAKLPVIAPGLVDLQVNGYKGVDFNDRQLTPEQVEQASEELLKTGVTKYFPTLITGSKKKSSELLKTLAEASGGRGLSARMIGGIHIEGPFISKEEGPRGAHPKRYCINPDPELIEQWQAESGGMIRIITLAPELPGSEELIRAAVEMGMVVALGHTDADSASVRRAVEAGATLSTHLGNGCHPLLPRHPNYIWDQLAEDRLYASMIADGFHLPDAVLKVFGAVKGERAVLVSDSMTYAGLKPGLYDSPATGKVRLTEEGRLHLERNPKSLAGSAGNLLGGVGKMAGIAGFSHAWDMGSVNPSELLNQNNLHGLQVGAHADLVLLDPDLEHPSVRRVLPFYGNGYRRGRKPTRPPG
ncbi:MAG: amidohydrolase family protein [Bacteroidota bacterium]